MSKEDFRGYLKIIAFMFVNERYEKWDKENSENKWTGQQKESVNNFFFDNSTGSNNVVNNLIEQIGNVKITKEVINVQTHKLIFFLQRIFNENTNNPEKTIEVIGRKTPSSYGGKKSRKSRKSKKSMKSKTIRKRNYSDYNNKT